MIKGLTLAWVSLICCVSAQAGVLFSTDGTATPGFFPANGASSTSGVFHAFQFTVGAGHGGTFDQLAVAFQTSTTFIATFDILDDSSGTLGSLIDQVAILTVGDSVSHLYTGNATNHVTLAAGSTYWIEAASTSGSDDYLWLEATPILNGREFSSATGYFNGHPMAAFALLENSTSAPEPSSWLLALSSLALLPLGRLLRSA